MQLNVRCLTVEDSVQASKFNKECKLDLGCYLKSLGEGHDILDTGEFALGVFMPDSDNTESLVAIYFGITGDLFKYATKGNDLVLLDFHYNTEYPFANLFRGASVNYLIDIANKYDINVIVRVPNKYDGFDKILSNLGCNIELPYDTTYRMYSSDDNVVIVHNKLVRNNIPNLIQQNGGSCVYRILDDKEFSVALDDKLREEFNEYMESKDTEELVDILEVVQSIAISRGMCLDDFYEKVEDKRMRKGGLFRRYFLETETRKG